MTLILKHLGVEPGDEVIIPAYTLADMVPLIRGLGARPVPADIDPQTFNICPEAVRRRLTSRTAAILALHAFGAPCEIDALVELAERHGLPVVEDCAHSLGATCRGRRTGSFGHAAFFSFETTKPVSTAGGGMVVSRDATLIDRIRAETSGDVPDIGPLRQKIRAVRIERLMFATGLAFVPLYLLALPRCRRLMNALYRRFQHVARSGIRYAPIQAQIGLRKLATLDDRIVRRALKARLLRSLLSPGIQTQRVGDQRESTWYFFVAVLPCGASRIRQRLLLRGIDAGIEEEVTDNVAERLGYDDCPNVQSIFSRAIALPFYDGMSDATIKRVAQALNRLVP